MLCNDGVEVDLECYSTDSAVIKSPITKTKQFPGLLFFPKVIWLFAGSR